MANDGGSDHQETLNRFLAFIDERRVDTARLIRTRMMAPDAAASDETLADLAVVLLALGQERAGDILSHLADFEVKELARAVVRTGNVPAGALREAVLRFERELREGEFSVQGGWDFTRHLLEHAREEDVARRLYAELCDEEGKTPAEGAPLDDSR